MSNRRTALTTFTALVAAVSLMSGCGGDDDGDTNDAAGASKQTSVQREAAAQVKEMMKRPTSIGIDEPIKGGMPKGLHVVLLECPVPTCIYPEFKTEAMEKVGWTLDRVEYGFTAEEVKAAWQEALRRNPDAIFAVGAPPLSFYRQEAEEAKKRDIPLLSLSSPEADQWLMTTGGGAWAPNAAKMIGTYLTSVLGPDVKKVMSATSSGNEGIHRNTTEFVKVMGELRPDIKVDVLDLPITSVGQDAATKIASYLQGRYREYGALNPSTGDFTLGLPAALAGSGIPDMPIVSVTTPPNWVDMIANGEAGAAATVPYPAADGMYRLMDALGRHIRGQSVAPSSDDTFPMWLVTRENVPKGEDPLVPVKNFKEQFYKLWGVQ
jgi:ribose transport system substrate-binding protein